MDFYLDESGNTGDAATLKWPNQPTFVLAAVGVESEDTELTQRVFALRKKHRIQMPELKGSKLYKSKPYFVRDLVEFIIENEYPIFVEVMDKKYYIVSLLVTYFLSSPQELYQKEEEWKDCNIIADILYDDFDDSVLKSYGKACLVRTPKAVYNFMYDFVMEVRNQYASLFDPATLSTGKGKARWANLMDIEGRGYSSTKAFEEMRREGIGGGELVSPFLPPSDENKRGEILAMLPHVSAFGNIYARINSEFEDEEIRLIHDEHAHFDHVIEDWHNSMSSNHFDFLDEIHRESNSIFSGKLRFKFNENHSIDFGNSENEIGIQIADMFAGFYRKYYEDFTKKGGGNREVYEEIVDLLWSVSSDLWGVSEGPSSTGINVVSSMKRMSDTFLRVDT